MNTMDALFLSLSSWLVAVIFLVIILFAAIAYHFYQRARIRAVLKDSDDVANLAAQKNMLEADVNELRDWIERQKEELLTLSGEREQQEIVRGELTQLERDLASKRQESLDILSQTGELEFQLENKRNMLASLESEIGDLEKKKEESAVLSKKLSDLHQELVEAQSRLDQISLLENKQNTLNSQNLLLEQEISEKQKTIEPLREQCAAIQTELEKSRHDIVIERNTLQNLQQENGNLSQALHQKKMEMDEFLQRKTALENKQNALNSQNLLLEQEISEKQKTIEPLREQCAATQTELEKSRHDIVIERNTLQNLQQENGNLSQALHQKKMEIDEFLQRKTALEVEIDKLKAEMNSLAAGTPEIENPAYDDLMKVSPSCLSQKEFASVWASTNVTEFEASLLNDFKESLDKARYHFPERVIDAFHTSLKCHDINPLTVLAGVSGTGKTLLPIRYAEFMGMHRLVMAVQPRWDSPQDMFGFYNYLEKKYKATELSRALVRMDPYNYTKDFKGNEWVHDRMLLVLLDEMNLARTEYYFSEFLSKLELRRLVDNPAHSEKRGQAELELGTGPGGRNFRIWVPENVLFVGTMNEDETTQTLSDKVLDRSNVLRFGKPGHTTVHSNGSLDGNPSSFLPYETWRSWKKNPESLREREQVQSWINTINEALDSVGRPFGYRVQQAMLEYVANYPLVNESERHKWAFADQIEQKILPKLRGLSMDNQHAVSLINNILPSIIDQLGDKEFGNAMSKASQASMALGMFYWNGITRA